MPKNKGLAQYEYKVVPGHTAKHWWMALLGGCWSCCCGECGTGYGSLEYAIAAKRRHLRKAFKEVRHAKAD